MRSKPDPTRWGHGAGLNDVETGCTALIKVRWWLKLPASVQTALREFRDGIATIAAGESKVRYEEVYRQGYQAVMWCRSEHDRRTIFHFTRRVLGMYAERWTRGCGEWQLFVVMVRDVAMFADRTIFRNAAHVPAALLRSGNSVVTTLGRAAWFVREWNRYCTWTLRQAFYKLYYRLCKHIYAPHAQTRIRKRDRAEYTREFTEESSCAHP